MRVIHNTASKKTETERSNGEGQEGLALDTVTAAAIPVASSCVCKSIVVADKIPTFDSTPASPHRRFALRVAIYNSICRACALINYS